MSWSQVSGKDVHGRVLATEVLKLEGGKMLPTIELSKDLGQVWRELMLALCELFTHEITPTFRATKAWMPAPRSGTERPLRPLVLVAETLRRDRMER
ncbi:hypothetical protein SNOG_07857 [Parastagonospora nodorum SN15]|uniref:Uncharacterized protein n=1 Tax=Phaeosphaeria nodorum (strain SN15 / ATCC MYA-4574 / FGSC 10173) TaxID=321614 RepID=Q0UK57_PHANO|nr:hypothetical protein SNOG_07857 [Parastagonospora nodorum SN15]EAT85323.1 hypothetical protein SNOG_07857 [Parastagonospora nodorum SN15]